MSKSRIEIPRCREQKPSSPGEQNILSLQSRLEKDTGTGGASSPNSPLAVPAWLGGCAPLTSQAVLTPATAPTIRNAESFSPSYLVCSTIFVMA